MKAGFLLSVLALSAGSLRADVEAFADLLVWCADECGAENWAQIFLIEGSTTNIDVLPASFGCDFGVRVGVDYFTCCDCWDVLGSYTWFRANGTGSGKTDGEIASAFLANFYINNADGRNLGPSYRGASMDWTIDLNVLDLELGRMFCASPCLSLRPFIGLKGGWIDQKLDTKWRDPTDPALMFTKATEVIRNDFWGIGPSAGLNLNWALGGCFSLFNEFSGALLYGHWCFSDRYRNDRPEKVTIMLPTISGAATMVRDYFGLAWEYCQFQVRVGYEGQVWLGQLQFYTLNLGRSNNPLTFQGGTLDFRLAF